MTNTELHQMAAQLSDSLVGDRRYLHQHPELSGYETGTARYIYDRLRAIGLEPRLLLEDRSVVADIVGEQGGGHALLLRADIDALPILERGKERPYRSTVDGVMHACGHDAHVAVALGVAALLVGLRDQLPGMVRLAFQPSEESAGGAGPMIGAGVLQGPKMEGALGLHIWSGVAAGTVGVRSGAIFASADEFSVVITGRGGHGALPHQALDPVPIASMVVLALQTLISRETSPFQSAVVTIGRIEGGQVFNVIPETVSLVGTVRAFTKEDRERLLRRVGEVASGIASAFGATATMERGGGCPPVISDPAMADLVRSAVLASPEVELVEPEPLTVGDDMALFLEAIPGCYFLLGGGNPEAGITAPHHHPEFDLDEACLPIGVEVLTRAALEFCRNGLGSTPIAE
ncbi:MAG TPA: amidohydrolase [Candidatus Dormibacteraeota bacterium]|nr:amidohydrolase [Candidatus Dormibacteraeota bacterium]